jgi:hypothetical protein
VHPSPITADTFLKHVITVPGLDPGINPVIFYIVIPAKAGIQLHGSTFVGVTNDEGFEVDKTRARH